MRLENWGVVRDNYDPYRAPELRTVHLGGNVFGNPKFEDGERIYTSRLTEIQCNENGTFIATTQSGSTYELGLADPEFLRVLGVKPIDSIVGKY
jgi:hypothetical protein